MAAEALTELLDASGVSYELLPHAHTERAAEEAAALGVPPDSVAKTLVLTMPDGYVRTVLSAADRLDLNKVREVLDAGSKKKIHLASEDELERDFPSSSSVPCHRWAAEGPGAHRRAYFGAGGARVRGRRPRRIRAPAGGDLQRLADVRIVDIPRTDMRLCLMVEGQEDVSWDEWLALADVCERVGPRRPVPLRPLPLGCRQARASFTRCDRDTGGAGGAHGADPPGHARLAGHLPPPVGAREVGGDDRPRVGRTGRARARRRVERGGARRLRLRVPSARHAHGAARGAAGDRPPPLDGGLGDVRGPALPTGRLSGAAEAAAAAAATAHPRGQRQAEVGRARSPARRRVQHAARVDRRLP